MKQKKFLWVNLVIIAGVVVIASSCFWFFGTDNSIQGVNIEDDAEKAIVKEASKEVEFQIAEIASTQDMHIVTQHKESEKQQIFSLTIPTYTGEREPFIEEHHGTNTFKQYVVEGDCKDAAFYTGCLTYDEQNMPYTSSETTLAEAYDIFNQCRNGDSEAKCLEATTKEVTNELSGVNGILFEVEEKEQGNITRVYGYLFNVGSEYWYIYCKNTKTNFRWEYKESVYVSMKALMNYAFSTIKERKE